VWITGRSSERAPREPMPNMANARLSTNFRNDPLDDLASWTSGPGLAPTPTTWPPSCGQSRLRPYGPTNAPPFTSRIAPDK
jgi:hypothetical protein